MITPPHKSKAYNTRVLFAVLLLSSAASALASERVARLTMERLQAQTDQFNVFFNPRYHYKVTYRGQIDMEVIGDTEYDAVTFKSKRGSIEVSIWRNTDLASVKAHLAPGGTVKPYSNGKLSGLMTTIYDKDYIAKNFCFSEKHQPYVPKAAVHEFFWSDDSDVFCIGAWNPDSPNWDEFYRLLNSFEFLPSFAHM
jgi:hypothetical protein